MQRFIIRKPSHLLAIFVALLIGLACTGLMACTSAAPERPTPTAWGESYLEAMRLPPDQIDGALEELARRAPTEEEARDANFERARIALRAGEAERARQIFQTLYDQRSDDAVGSRSLYELGRLAAEHDGNPDEAVSIMTRAVVETTPWAGSQFALDFLLRQEKRRDRRDELIDGLAQMAEDSQDDRMAARLHLERGLLLDSTQRDANGALQAYRAAFGRCAECAATDDALYAMAMIYTRYQDWDSAVATLDILAGRTGKSYFIGTYNSHRAADARYQLGLIEMLFRDDYAAATRHFRTYIDDFPNHRETDDAAWHLVELERFQGRDRAYRRALERFVRDYPHSGHVERAQRRLEEAQ